MGFALEHHETVTNLAASALQNDRNKDRLADGK